MKTVILAILVGILLVKPCKGEQVNIADIRQLMERMDDSLVRGNIYHINYAVCDKRTDAFYASRAELIKLFQDMMVKEQSESSDGRPNADSLKRWDDYQGAIKTWKKDLTRAREQTTTTDYSLDGKGFYLKRSITAVTSDGKPQSASPTIYVSDGKIMGSFYPAVSQATLQPATERPQSGGEDWTETAYLFIRTRISTYMADNTTLTMKDEGDTLVITGEKPAEKKALSHAELRIDKATLTPQSLIYVYYNAEGTLYGKWVKTWQYQNIAGLWLPKTVAEQEYKADLVKKSFNLEKERIFTLNTFDPIPMDSKAEFGKLLKTNCSIFDEITGTHYLSGTPSDTLDKLSQ